MKLQNLGHFEQYFIQTLLHHINKMGTDRVLVLFGNSFACIQQFCPILTPNVSKGPRADGTWGAGGP